MLEHDTELTGHVIAACIEVHRHLGPGLLESTYEACLAHELTLRGLEYERQVSLPLLYKRMRIENAYRIDFIIEGRLPLELKSVEMMHPAFAAQVLTYLELLERPVGLLINFYHPVLRQGIHRIARSRQRASFSKNTL